MQNLKSNRLTQAEELNDYLKKGTSKEEIKSIMESEVFRAFLRHTEGKFIEMYPTRSDVEHVQVANMYSVNGVKEFLELLEREAKEIVFTSNVQSDDDDLLKDFA